MRKNNRAKREIRLQMPEGAFLRVVSSFLQKVNLRRGRPSVVDGHACRILLRLQLDQVQLHPVCPDVEIHVGGRIDRKGLGRPVLRDDHDQQLVRAGLANPVEVPQLPVDIDEMPIGLLHDDVIAGHVVGTGITPRVVGVRQAAPVEDHRGGEPHGRRLGRHLRRSRHGRWRRVSDGRPQRVQHRRGRCVGSNAIEHLGLRDDGAVGARVCRVDHRLLRGVGGRGETDGDDEGQQRTECAGTEREESHGRETSMLLRAVLAPTYRSAGRHCCPEGRLRIPD